MRTVEQRVDTLSGVDLDIFLRKELKRLIHERGWTLIFSQVKGEYGTFVFERAFGAIHTQGRGD